MRLPHFSCSHLCYFAFFYITYFNELHHFIQFNYESNCWCCRHFLVTSEISNQYLFFIWFSAWVRLSVTHARAHKHALIQLPIWCPCRAPCQTLALLTRVEGTRHWSHNWMIIQLTHMKKYEGDLKWTQQILTPRLGLLVMMLWCSPLHMYMQVWGQHCSAYSLLQSWS